MTEKRRQYFRDRYKKIVGNGKCIVCGEDLDREGAFCTKCLAVNNKEKRDSDAFYKSIGICPTCRRNQILGDEKNCPECRAKFVEYANKYREGKENREHYNEVHKVWARSEHQRRIAEGICTRCGKRKADYGYKTCGICRDKDAKRRRVNIAEQRKKSGYLSKEQKIKRGICIWCDNPVYKDFKFCKEHYDAQVDKLDNELVYAERKRKRIQFKGKAKSESK